MNIVVCVKQVPSSEARVQIAPDGKSIDRASAEMVVNPYDEYAIEEALRIRDRFAGSTITVLSIGPAKAEEALRTCLALGADRALIVKDDSLLGGDDLQTARILAGVIRPLQADLVLAGKVSIDVENHGVAVALAEELGMPHVSAVTEIVWTDEKRLRARREIENAAELVEVELPAVLTANKGLNEPRYPSLPGIMKAKKKPIEAVDPASLGQGADALGPSGAQLETVALEPIPPRAEGKKLQGDARESVLAVLKALREERKLL
ncbi:MAG: electron transfer flavoprotein subunit beta [Candidatus Eisenbacteria bacterium]|nr:electron transfer flavoprotein subunit beta/FixA family protein [Candidatus Eisenbacteria bacterium]